MANIKISELEEITTVADDDVLPIVDVSEGETRKIKHSQINEDYFNGNKTMGNIVVESIASKNLFNKYGSLSDYIEWSSGNTTLESDGKIKATANIVNGNGKGQIIQLKPNTTYTFSAKIDSFEIDGYTMFRILAINGDGSATNRILNVDTIITAGKTYSYQFTTGSTGKIWLTLNGIINYSDYTISKYVIYDNIQIEKGSFATEYTSSYKKFGYNSQESMGEIVVDDISCKNLFDINSTPKEVNNADYTISNNTIIVNTYNIEQTSVVKMPFDYKLNTNYTISLDITVNSNNYNSTSLIQIRGSSVISTIEAENIAVGQTKHYEQTFNTKDIEDLTLWLYAKSSSNAGIINITYSNIQIELGDTATPYTPYKEFDNRPKLLWKNPYPSDIFATQNITLSNSDYDMLIWIFDTYITSGLSESEISLKGFGVRTSISNEAGTKFITRTITRNSDTSFTIGSGYINGTVDENSLIPRAIYGLKISQLSSTT